MVFGVSRNNLEKNLWTNVFFFFGIESKKDIGTRIKHNGNARIIWNYEGTGIGHVVNDWANLFVVLSTSSYNTKE